MPNSFFLVWFALAPQYGAGMIATFRGGRR
jgi:hypothetical protein